MPLDPKRLEEWKTIRAEMDALELYDAVGDLLAEREEMLGVLRDIQGGREYGDVGACPLCARTGTEHAPDCRLAAFLKE